MDSLSNRNHQQRSHSISGQEFYSNGGYQRLKQSIYTQQAMVDGHQSYSAHSNSNRSHQIQSPYQQHSIRQSPSPLSVNCQQHFVNSPQSKYPQLDKPQKNLLHASLECLNTSYTSQKQNQVNQLQQHQQHLQQQQLQQLQQHQTNFQNQHYAASYVLATPPANTIINQNGNQDMAEAAMGASMSQYHHSMTTSVSPSLNTNTYNHQTQTLINKALAHVSNSPLRRIGINGASGTGASSGILNHLTNINHPMRAGHSSLSLASSSFIIEDKLQNEIRKLHSELKSEKEKNEALNSQLNINSNLMAAFEQSLTTLNTRLRQLTTLNEKKDNEIEKLKEQLKFLSSSVSPESETTNSISDNYKPVNDCEKDNSSEERELIKVVEDLKRQLVEKDRLLTDTRLDALSSEHQLEQLRSKLDGEHSLLNNEDDLDEGVMEVNQSPSDSDAITDSTHFNDINDHLSKFSQRCNSDNLSFTANNNNNENNNVYDNSPGSNNADNQSNHSSDYLVEVKGHSMTKSISQQFYGSDSGLISELTESLH